jgi:ADP-ribose pyrophosphatase YjhB (NUDIX family)
MQKKFTVRVRLILLCSEHVLVAYHQPTNTHFMPGGGLEHGESSINCLRREIAEECDLTLPRELAPFGILENCFTEANRDVHEVLIHFAATLDEATPPQVNSREADLAFFWVPLATLTETEIWPPTTYAAIRAAQTNKLGFHYAPLESLVK